MNHVYEIVEILRAESPFLKKNVAPAIIDPKGIAFPEYFIEYPQAVVSSVAYSFKEINDTPVGKRVKQKEISVEFEVTLKFDANVEIYDNLTDETIAKNKKNIEIIDDTISNVFEILQSRRISVLGNCAYINLTDCYLVAENEGVTVAYIVYAVSGTANFKKDIEENISFLEGQVFNISTVTVKENLT